MRPEIVEADQTSMGFRSKHGVLTDEGGTAREYNTRPALTKC